MEFGGKEINLDILQLDSLPENDIFSFGGPDIVQIVEQRQEELKKRERQNKRLEKERQMRQATRVQQASDAKPMSRFERKVARVIELSKHTAPTEDAPLLNPSSRSGFKDSHKHGEKNGHNSSSDSDSASDTSQSQSRIRSESAKVEAQSKTPNGNEQHYHQEVTLSSVTKVFRQLPTTLQEGCDAHNNTHLNLQHPIPETVKLFEYINQYERNLGPERLTLAQQNRNKIRERKAQQGLAMKSEMMNESGDKFRQSLVDLCNKQAGLDLNQPLKSLLLNVK